MPADPDPKERRRIINAAYRCLIASNGATVSVADILAEAGLSTRAFYRHFESKDGLLLAMFRQDSERVFAELDTAVAQAGSPAEALGVFIHGTLRMTAEPRRRERVLIIGSEEARRARGYPAEVDRSRAAQQATIAGILRRGHTDGTFPLTEPDSDARSLQAALNWAFEEQLTGVSQFDAQQAAAALTDFALRALGAPTAGRVADRAG